MSHDTATERVFGYLGAEVRVRASAALLDWLAELVTPWLEVRDRPLLADVPCVEIRVEVERTERWLASAEPTDRDEEWFTFDHARATWPVLRGRDGRALAVDAHLGVALGAVARSTAGEPTHIEVLASRERPGARLTALRLVRELASVAALRRGALPVHAAALADNRGVTLIVGPKNAGKSSILVHALASHGARYVTNDRAFVTVEGDVPQVRGMPSIVGIRDGTFALAPGLGDELGSGAWHYTATVGEARANRAANRSDPNLGATRPPGVSPAQLCAILGTEPIAGGAVDCVVFSEIDRSAAGSPSFALERLASDDACARLIAHGLVAGGRAARELGGATPGPDELARAARRLVSRTRCVSCVLGPRAYDSPSLWSAIRGGEA